MSKFSRKAATHLVAGALAFAAASAQAGEVQGYTFPNAAQEITQLFWLAETANLCGWASDEDTLRFKSFAVRFLAAHLSSPNRVALVSLITENDYEGKVRKAAAEGVADNCVSRRWQLGWANYKTAADEHDTEY
jgi:hypothetical protein